MTRRDGGRTCPGPQTVFVAFRADHLAREAPIHDGNCSPTFSYQVVHRNRRPLSGLFHGDAARREGSAAIRPGASYRRGSIQHRPISNSNGGRFSALAIFPGRGWPVA